MEQNGPYQNQSYQQQPGYPQQPYPQQPYPQQPYPQQPGMYPNYGGYQQPVRQYTVSFGEAISRGFSNYANFSGRASRSEYWWWYLFNILILLIPAIMIISGMITASMADYSYNDYSPYAYDTDSYSSMYEGLGSGLGLIGLVLYIICALALFIPSLALVWRRLHDIGRSGAWYLLNFVPCLGYIWGIVMLVFCCTPSNPFDNEYGPVPNQLS